jgi:hypothetical protein
MYPRGYNTEAEAVMKLSNDRIPFVLISETLGRCLGELVCPRCLTSSLNYDYVRAKSDYSFVISVRQSVCPHGTTRLPREGFSRNLILDYFSENCRSHSSFIKTGKNERVLYMKVNIHFYHMSLNIS